MDVHDVLARLLANRLELAGLLISVVVVIAALQHAGHRPARLGG